MNLDYLHAAKVIANFLQEDDSAYENDEQEAFDCGKRIISALQAAGFQLVHKSPNTEIPASSMDA